MIAKPVARILLIALLLAGAAGLLLLVELPALGLGGAIVERAKRDLGVDLTRGRFRLNLLDGVVLEDAEAVAISRGLRYRASLPRVRFVHEPRALLSGVLEVRRILLDAPLFEIFEEDSEQERVAASSQPGASWLRFDVEEVVVGQASILSSAAGSKGADSKLEGVDIRFTELGVLSGEGLGGSILALEGSGEFRAERALLGEIEVSQASSQIYLHEGQVSLTLLNFRTDSAPFVAEMRVELEGAPFDYTVSSLGEPFDLGPLVGAEPGAFGDASLLLEVFGRGPAAGGFRAQGSVTLPAGGLPKVPLLVAVNESLGREVFPIGEAYRETLAVIRVRDGYVQFQPFELASERGVATLRGRVYLTGELDMELVLHDAPGSAAEEVLRLRGTIEEPRIEPP